MEEKPALRVRSLLCTRRQHRAGSSATAESCFLRDSVSAEVFRQRVCMSKSRKPEVTYFDNDRTSSVVPSHVDHVLLSVRQINVKRNLSVHLVAVPTDVEYYLYSTYAQFQYDCGRFSSINRQQVGLTTVSERSWFP